MAYEVEMNTIILKICEEEFDDDELLPAARALAAGKLVAFPTETVYGLGANALDPDAVARIFAAKGRPSDNPLIVHISSIEQIEPLVARISPKARALMESFWPGPLTVICEKSALVPDIVTAGLPTVAVRMPDNRIALKLIELSGVPVAGPSANISGRPSPTDAAHTIQDLEGRVDYIIDGGKCGVGIESTVIDMTVDPPAVLRPGGITYEMIAGRIGEVAAERSGGTETAGAPKSPGMKYRHYSPKAVMTIVEGDVDRVAARINELVAENASLKTGVLASNETLHRYDADIVLCPGSNKNPESVAAGIYDCLRKFDDLGVEVIFSEAFSEQGIGHATMNRLKKAAGGRIIKV
jgi:L-threonylcarbamoyladenylate synthase